MWPPLLMFGISRDVSPAVDRPSTVAIPVRLIDLPALKDTVVLSAISSVPLWARVTLPLPSALAEAAIRVPVTLVPPLKVLAPLSVEVPDSALTAPVPEMALA